MKPPAVSVLDGSTFAVSDTQGDMLYQHNQVLGVFFRDTRHLSEWRLTVNGRSMDALSDYSPSYDRAEFFLVVGTNTVYRNPTVSIRRIRQVGDGMREELHISNNCMDEVRIEVAVLFDADFADVFAVKDHLPRKGEITRTVRADGVRLRYRRGDFVRETDIVAQGAFWTDQAMTFYLQLDPQQTWRTEIQVRMTADAQRLKPKSASRPNMAQSLDEWISGAPTLDADWNDLKRTYDRSLVDLAALRFFPDAVPGSASLPAAGLPWFMALFGRDSLITSYQALPFVPELAATTLRALAARQATACDDFRDAEPGKILHELRFGEMSYFHERPQSPYYGSADSTPLFLILLDEYERWTGDQDLVRSLEPAARAALRWIDEYGDRDGDGYQEYQPRNTDTGLVNQCWKDSWNSILHPDGRLASQPRATCELQGYAYDAKLRTARLARRVWGDGELARDLEQAAGTLKDRFNRDYWVSDGDFFALALDGDKKQVATLTSNMGQLLWSGIVADEHAAGVARQLMASPLFSGWGVRTLAQGQPAYNPIEYHNGTVWPHDNSLIAAGLARYGHRDEAARIAKAILDAATYFAYRLPETFAGFSRAETGAPVEYPSACSPQAWAAGTPLLLLRVLLDVEPGSDHNTLDPETAKQFGRIELRRQP
jgi:glycogen debranching enzyme